MAAFVAVEPYSMCTQHECKERIRTNEVSRFEKSNGQLDPRKAVSKYRRSAASGFSHVARAPPRSLVHLEATVQYLAHFLVQEMRNECMPAVGFVEDRLRAVQVDLIKTQASSKNLQMTVARCHILILYLLSDCSISQRDKNSYERKFGQSALRTALAAYWNTTAQHDQQQADFMDDEMLSYSILVQLNQQLEEFQVTGDTSCMSTLWFNLTELYQRVGGISASLQQQQSSSPCRFQWTMQLVSLIALQHWQSALTMVCSKTSSINVSNGSMQQFRTFAQCCMAPSLAFLRWKALQAYNMTLGKNEGITGEELARLLCIPAAGSRETSLDNSTTPEAAIEFGKTFGLPLNDDNRKLVMKSLPIQPFRPMNIRHNNDALIVPVCGTPMAISKDGIAVPSVKWMEELLLERRSE